MIYVHTPKHSLDVKPQWGCWEDVSLKLYDQGEAVAAVDRMCSNTASQNYALCIENYHSLKSFYLTILEIINI